MAECRICGNAEGNNAFIAKDMRWGTRRDFTYMECASCGCVQLVDVIADMSEYYSNDSYAAFSTLERSWPRRKARALRNAYAVLGRGGVMGWLLDRLTPLPPAYRIVGKYASRGSRVLDVGCGIGSYIRDLGDIGFKQVSVIDPFLEKDIVYPNGVTVRRMFVQDLNDSYDVVISHHSFEHVPDPEKFLDSIRKNLAPRGVCILTIPVAEDLYRQYGKDCYLLQAPQHLFLYTIKGFSLLAQDHGLKIEKEIRSADSAVIWDQYSSLWRRDISVAEIDRDLDAYFSAEELRCFHKNRADLSAQRKGDNVTFILSRCDEHPAAGIEDIMARKG